MIDIGLQLQNIERLMRLMKKYKIDELSVDYINLKRNPTQVDKPIRKRKKPDLSNHVQSIPDEPWNDITDEHLNQWSQNGKV